MAFCSIADDNANSAAAKAKAKAKSRRIVAEKVIFHQFIFYVLLLASYTWKSNS